MKRALILSGGGAKGAFTVGALSKLEERGINAFDVISGASTGALIAALICANRLQILRDVYRSVQNSDILNPQNIVQNLLATNPPRPYLFDSTPLEQIIDQHVTESVYQDIRTSSSTLCLTAINLQTGRPTIFSSKRIDSTMYYEAITIRNHGHLKKALLASSNQAAFLPPVTIPVNNKNFQFVDGGNREVVPTRVVANLMPPGPNLPNLPSNEIYLISNNPRNITDGKEQYKSFLDVLFRAISIFVQDVRENDINVIMEYRNRTGAKLIIIEPRNDLDPEFPTGLRFDPI